MRPSRPTARRIGARPAHEKGAIANRIAWLLKETGHDFAARRQFNRARGSYAAFTPYVTWAIMAICVAAYLLDVVLTQGRTLQFFGGDRTDR